VRIEIGRPESRLEWGQIRDLCCETGDAGKPVETDRWPFFAEYWIGPYQRVEPDWTFVARRDSRVVGYLTGCPASLPFYLRRFFLQRVPLYLAVLLGRWSWTQDVRRFLHPLEGVRRSMAYRFGARLYWRLLTRYPAHLHINVRERHREGGTGRALVEAYVARLSEAGVRGLHLFCWKGPVPFYRRVGFHRMATVDFGKGPVYVMVRRIPKKA
jgi:GNAT superfamily N-acetyltransferase